MSFAKRTGSKASLTAVFLLLCGCAVAVAQETTGALFGHIRSQDGAPLPGVTVTVANSANGLRLSAVADGSGEYRFLALPPATYGLEATLQGFRPHRETITVILGQTAMIDIEMQLGAFADAIEVTASRPPPIDVTSTVVGMTTDVSELNDHIPLRREVTQVALLAPGTEPADQRFNGRTPGQNLASVYGASVAENLYVVNGLNITNFREMLGSTRVPFEFLAEAQIKTGGYEAEFGRSTGGVFNMVTRSGSNQLHLDANLYALPEGLQGRQPDTVFAPNSRESTESLEANLSLGGSIVRDRLFYFLFASYEDGETLDYVVGSSQVVRVDNLSLSQPYWGGKVDWNVASGHRLEATFLSDRIDVDVTRWQYNPITQVLSDPLGTGVNQRGGDNGILRYSGMFGQRTLLSLQAGRNEFARTDRSDGDDCPLALDRRSVPPLAIGCFVNMYRGNSGDTREAYRADLDYIVGGHSLRAGGDFEHSVSNDDTSYSGGVGYQYWLNGPRFPALPPATELVLVAYFTQGGSFDVFSNAAYVQDSWAVSQRLTLNLGLRWERYDNRNGLGETFIETTDQWAPRLGLVWDPKGDGRSKVYGSYGVYYLPIASNTNVKVAGAVYRSTGWYVLDGGVNPDGSPEALGEELAFTLLYDGETPDPREVISDNFEPMSQEEVIAGYEHAIGTTWSLGVRGVARRFNQVIEDYSIQHALTTVYGLPFDDGDFVYRIGNPGSDLEGWYDLDGDGVLDRVHLSAEALGYPKAERNYYGVDLIFKRRFADNWALQGSYTWSHLYGNYEGYTNSDVGQSDPGVTQTFDTPALLEHSSGNLPNDRRHTAKLFGTYSWPWGLQLGGNLFFSTGRPINSFGLNPTVPAASSYGAVYFYTGGEPRARGCCGTTDSVWNLDAMARYSIQLGTVTMSLRLDLFNAFDNHAAVRVDELGELDNGEANPTYSETIAYQTPRRVRFGFGLSF
jgi:outer membrane receptor protein involved in Fe transport